MNLWFLLGKRIGAAALTLLIVSAIVFSITNLLPGDAAQAMLGQSGTPQAINALREALGLNLPAPQRYFNWLTGLISGDAGYSLTSALPVSELIGDRLPRSLVLAGLTAFLSVPIALALGIGSAMYSGSAIDRNLSLITVSYTHLTLPTSYAV